MESGYYFRENWSAVWKQEFSFHSQSSMWGEYFSVNSRIVLENFIFWYRIMVPRRLWQRSQPKNYQSITPPPPPPGSKKQTQYKNYWCNPTWKTIFLGGLKPRLSQLPRLKFPIIIIPRKESWSKVTLIKFGGAVTDVWRNCLFKKAHLSQSSYAYF